MLLKSNDNLSLSGFTELEENTEVIVNGELKQRRTRRVARETDDGSKWRPYWHRGHTTIDERRQQASEREKRTSTALVNTGLRKKLYHSNLDISSAGKSTKRVKIAQYASTQGLNGIPFVENGLRNVHEHANARLSITNSSLNLPSIDPEQDLRCDVNCRDLSAVTSRSGARNGRLSSTNGTINDTESDESDEEVYKSDDDPEVSRKNLDKAGDYIVEHDWILKGNIQEEARRVALKHNKVRIPLPDEDPLEAISLRMEEVNRMVKPRAELGNFLDTIDPEQRNRIMVRIS